MDKSLYVYIYIFIHVSGFLCMRLSGHKYSIVNTHGSMPSMPHLEHTAHAFHDEGHGKASQKIDTLLDLCVSSLRRGHANLLCIVPILTDDPRRESKLQSPRVPTS